MLNRLLASGVREMGLTLIPACMEAERGSAPCLRATPAGTNNGSQRKAEDTGTDRCNPVWEESLEMGLQRRPWDLN